MEPAIKFCFSDITYKCELTPHPAMYYVYMIRNKDTQELYYGYTNNLERRICEHNKKQSWELIYYEAYKAESDAYSRERQLKRYAQALTALKMRLKGSLEK